MAHTVAPVTVDVAPSVKVATRRPSSQAKEARPRPSLPSAPSLPGAPVASRPGWPGSPLSPLGPGTVESAPAWPVASSPGAPVASFPGLPAAPAFPVASRPGLPAGPVTLRPGCPEAPTGPAGPGTAWPVGAGPPRTRDSTRLASSHRPACRSDRPSSVLVAHAALTRPANDFAASALLAACDPAASRWPWMCPAQPVSAATTTTRSASMAACHTLRRSDDWRWRRSVSSSFVGGIGHPIWQVWQGHRGYGAR